MIRMLIVDDEPMSRRHITEDFPWRDWGCEVVAEAENGAQALELCMQLKPDIALVDITMPVMDGLTLLDKLNEFLPGMQKIMITAHRDFHYIQEAMRKGAAGYILKAPVQLEETKEALDRAIQQLEKERSLSTTKQLRQNVLQQHQYPLRKNVFNQLLTGLLHTDQELLQQASAIGVELHEPPYVMMVIEALPLAAFQQRFTGEDQSLIEFSMLEIIRESVNSLMPGRFELFPVTVGRMVLMGSIQPEFVGSQASAPQLGCRKMLARVYDSFKEPLLRYMNLNVAVSASEPFFRLSDWKRSYTRCLHVLEQQFYLQEPALLFTDRDFLRDPQDDPQAAALRSKLKELAAGTPSAMDSFDDWKKAVTASLQAGSFAPDKAKSWLAGLQELFPVSTELQGKISRWPQFHYAGTLHEALRQLELWFADWLRVNRKTVAVRPEVARAVQFIKEHLSEEISLDAVAEHVQLSPSYLGNIFKKDVGTSVIDYVLEQRIELAKVYLSEGKYRNYELADKVGFNHYSYFSTMFKKYTGMSPNEYKQGIKPKLMME